jgi:small-conductance mechanosensitive channel
VGEAINGVVPPALVVLGVRGLGQWIHGVPERAALLEDLGFGLWGQGLAFKAVLLGAIVWVLLRWINGFNRTWLKRTSLDSGSWDALVVPLVVRTARVVLPLLALGQLVQWFELPAPLASVADKLTSLGVIVGIVWFLVQGIRTIERGVVEWSQRERGETVAGRRLLTQVVVIRRIAVFAVILMGVACVLMLFSPMRQLGASLLASAGIAGIVGGLAAQQTLSHLFAGIQIAVTQPVRIEDVVTIEGQFGRVEEITLTYVVVRTWDLRRLVIPITHLLQRPFENWTRLGGELLGTVFLSLDYSIPVDVVRRKARELAEATPLWNKSTLGVQVTEANDRCIQVRVVVSANSAGELWDLRCLLREQLVAWLQVTYPDCLPRVRTLAEGEVAAGATVA